MSSPPQFAILTAIKGTAVQNTTNNFWVILGVGWTAGDLAGSSNTNILKVNDTQGNQISVIIASTAAGAIAQPKNVVVPPGGKMASDLTSGVNIEYVSVPLDDLWKWL